MAESIELDHIVVGVRDLDDAVERLRRDFGLGALPEVVSFPPTGTGSRHVPLGTCYLELLTVIDPEAAANDPLGFGQYVSRGIASGDRLLSWAVRSPDLDAVSPRLRLRPTSAEGLTTRGERLGCKLVGFAELIAGSHPAHLPFVINADNPFSSALDAQVDEAGHAFTPRGIAWLEVSGDPDSLDARLGDANLSIIVRPGDPRIHAFAVASTSGEVVIRL